MRTEFLRQKKLLKVNLTKNQGHFKHVPMHT